MYRRNLLRISIQMARQERRNLANARALEEEAERVVMRGAGAGSAYGGRMTGAGATPSMGLSQFRGGGRRRKARSPSPDDEEEMYDDEDMEGGFLGALASAARAAAARAAQASARAAAQARAAADNARRAAQGRATQVRPSTGTAPRPLPKTTPAPPAPKPAAPAAPKTPAPRPADKVIAGPKGKPSAPVGSTRQAISTGVSRLGTIANVAVPAYMLADYLRQQGQSEDLGYFDDYAGTGTPEDVAEGADIGDAGGETGMPDEFDTQADTGITDTGEMMGDTDALAASMGLSRKEFEFYQRTGNLPVRRGVVRGRGAGSVRRPAVESVLDRFVPPPARTLPIRRKPFMPSPPPRTGILPQPPAQFRPLPRVPQIPRARPAIERRQRERAAEAEMEGSGQLTIHHGGAKKQRPSRATGRRAERAEIVRKVMKERGVKLGEASRIVKEEGLF